ncbi:MAG TPA: hypothetical protein DEB31_11950 [Clostridiales bacterium]|nr:hypothetical protein [Clostridiales bacterium]
MGKSKHTIEHKVFLLALRITLLSVLVIAAVTIVGLFVLRAATLTIHERLGARVAETSEAMLEEQALQELSIAAKGKASISDQQLNLIQYFTELLASDANSVLHYPDLYEPVPVRPPDPELAGEYSLQLLLGNDVGNSAVQTEASLLGNLGPLMLAIPENSSDVMAVYVGLERGYTLMADEVSDRKEAGSYDARTRPWYTAAAEAGGPIWTDIYEDNYGRGLSITCAVPFYDHTGALLGVAGIDVRLSDLSNISDISRLEGSAEVYLMNRDGLLIAEDQSAESGGAARVWVNLLESEDEAQRALAERMNAGGEGVERVTLEGSDVFFAFAPMESLGWSFAIVMPVEDVLEPIHLYEQSLAEMQAEAVSGIDRTIGVVVIVFAIAAGLSILVISAASRRFAHTLTTPITQLQSSVQAIALGDLDHRIDLQTGDEIEELGLSVNKMAADLRTYIDNLQQVTADRERIGAELSIATEIQASMLPFIFPPFPERTEFELYASMQPAKEVGGDFYDFFLIDEDTLAVVMADASGKGVPAALFMVITKTLIKNNAQNGMQPAQVFEVVNNLLCESNRTGMFVTAFMGYLDIPTGRVTYVNAGHTPPLLRRAERKYEVLRVKPGLVLAGIDGIVYKQHEIHLHPGDELFLYTDGVTEMMNPQNELFGEARMVDAANARAVDNFGGMLNHMKDAVFRFADGAEQADDITMLALRYKGG